MILWAILTLMTVLAAVLLTVSLTRWSAPGETAVEALADQIAKTEAKVEAGKLSPSAAQPKVTALKRKMLKEAAEPQAPPRPLKANLVLPLSLMVAALVAVAATGLYAVLAPPAAPGAASLADHPGGDVEAGIEQLEAFLSTNPNDAASWGMLGWSYMRIGRYDEAVEAYARATALTPADPNLLAEQGQALMAAAGGQVTPEARTAFQNAVAIDPSSPAARYFLALAKDQAGDFEGAMDDWVALLQSAPPGADWAVEIRSRVEETAGQRGIDVSGRLPQVSAALTGVPAKGPDAGQVAAASQLPADQQQAMIAGMVDGLAARLKTDPQDIEGWSTLMRSRVNLGQRDLAVAAYREALGVFSGSPADQTKLRQLAQELGLPG